MEEKPGDGPIPPPPPPSPVQIGLTFDFIVPVKMILMFLESQRKDSFINVNFRYPLTNTHFLNKKIVLGQPNGKETFSSQATEVKKLIFFSFIFLLQF